MIVFDPFTLSIVLIVVLALFGQSIGIAMLCGTIVYLGLRHFDTSIAAETVLQGLFNSYTLLAIPLFILAADIMNIGTLADRLLRFSQALVGRFRGGLGHVNVVSSLIFSGMSGSAVADAVGHGPDHHQPDDQGRKIHAELRRRDHRRLGDHRADHSAVDPDGPLRARLGYLHRLPVRRRHPARPADGPGADRHERGHRAPAQAAGRRSRAAGRDPGDHGARVPGADAAGHPARRHLWRRR